MTADYYKALGVTEDVAPDELKKVYRKLAKKFHPDHNPGNKQAEAKFKEVQEAYSVLSDEKKRREYDMMRKYGGAYAGGPTGWSGPAGGPGFDFNQMFRGGQGGPAGGQWTFHFGGNRPENMTDAEDLGDLFGSLFGGRDPFSGHGPFNSGGFTQTGRGGRRRATRRPRKGGDIASSLTVTFIEAALGVEKTLHLHGLEKTIRVKIPAGIDDGGKIRLRGQGQPDPHGGENGDLIITVQVMPDQNFRREGNDVYTTAEISFVEAIKGCKVNVKTLTRTVALTIPAGTQPGAKLRLKGMGLKVGDATGDLYVEIKVTIPKTLTEKQQRLLEEWEG